MASKRKLHKSRKSRRKSGGNNFSKMNCSPATKGTYTCYTADALNEIKHAFNKGHRDNPIIKTKSNEIWNELKQRLSHCNREDCWLKELKDDAMRNQIDEYVFAPDRPPDWKANPNAWLSNYDLMNVLKQYEVKYPHFKNIDPTTVDFDYKLGSGKCVSNALCKFSIKQYIDKGITKIGIIFNSDKHTGSGLHWFSLFIDIEHKFIFFFDSNGEKVPSEIMVLVKRIQKEWQQLFGKTIKFYQNHPKSHQRTNTECGMYSLFFIITMLTDEADSKPLITLNDKLAFFKDRTIPDKCVEKFRNIYFNAA